METRQFMKNCVARTSCDVHCPKWSNFVGFVNRMGEKVKEVVRLLWISGSAYMECRYNVKARF